MSGNLVGYVRKSNAGNAVKINLLLKEINAAERVDTKKGKVIPLVINIKNLLEVIDGEKEVTSISQLISKE